MQKKEFFILVCVCAALIAVGIISKSSKEGSASYDSEAIAEIKFSNNNNVKVSYVGVNGYTIVTVPAPYRTLYIGEAYAMRYNAKTEDTNVLFYKPVFDKKLYKIINNVSYEKSYLSFNNVIVLNYKVDNVIIERYVMLEKQVELAKNGLCSIYCNISNPKISYLYKIN